MYAPFIKSNSFTYTFGKDGRILVEGIAADISRDIMGDQATPEFLKALETTLPGRAVYYNHNYDLPPQGVVLDARCLDGGRQLWVKAELYPYDPATREGILNGSLAFFSIGAVGTEVETGAVNGRPTRYFRDGYAKELTITGVPVNPCASFFIAKSFTGSNPDVYNTFDDNDEAFIKSFEHQFKVNPIEEYRRVSQRLMEEKSMFDPFNKAAGGAMMYDYWNNTASRTGINPPAAQARAGRGGFPEGQQLQPMQVEGVIKKSYEIATALSNSEDEFWPIFNFFYQKGISGSSESLNRTPPVSPGPFSGNEGFNAKDVTGELANYLRQTVPGAPNYGTQPWDAKHLVEHLKQINFHPVGYDDSFVAEAANRTPWKEQPPVGSDKNPGIDSEGSKFLNSNMKPLPPATKSNGKYVNSGKTNITKSWQDLLNDNDFMTQIHHSEYVGLMGQGEKESEVEYIHRLTHERGSAPSGSDWVKAMDGEMINALNFVVFDQLCTEDLAIVHHLMDDIHHGEVFYKCLNNPRCAHNEENRRRAELEFTKASKAKDDDEDDEKEGEDEKHESKESPKEEKDEKKGKGDSDDKKGKDDKSKGSKDDDSEDDGDDKKNLPPWLKKGEDVKKAFAQSEYMQAMLQENANERVLRAQASAEQNGWIKGLHGGGSGDTPKTAPKFADPLEEAIHTVLTTGAPQY